MTSSMIREEIAPGISLEWLFERRANIVTFNTVAQSSLKTWADKTMEMFAAAPLDDPAISIYDLSFEKAAMTPALRGHLRDIASFRPDLTACIGVILPKTTASQLIALATRSMQKKNRTALVFVSKADALSWVQTLL